MMIQWTGLARGVRVETRREAEVGPGGEREGGRGGGAVLLPRSWSMSLSVHERRRARAGAADERGARPSASGEGKVSKSQFCACHKLPSLTEDQTCDLFAKSS